MSEEANDIVEQSEGIVTDDADAAFLRAVEPMMDKMLGEEPEGYVEKEEEPEKQEEVAEDETEDKEGSEETGDEEQEEEDAPKYSLRKDGKKVPVEELLHDTLHTVKINGEEEEVEYDELINGFQRGKDYANKTTELKQEREELRPYAQMVAFAKEDPQFVEYVQNYFQHGPYPEAANNPLLKVTDSGLAGLLDENNADYDPHKAAEVIKARNEWQTKSAERQQTSQRVQKQMNEQFNTWATGEIQKAQTIINEIGGEDAYQKDGADVKNHLAQTGFSEQEISQLVDARMAVTAWKAMQYDKLKEGAETLSVRIGKKRKKLTPPKAASAGQGKSKPSSNKRQRDTLRKAVKSQSNDDWITAIEQRLNL